MMIHMIYMIYLIALDLDLDLDLNDLNDLSDDLRRGCELLPSGRDSPRRVLLERAVDVRPRARV